MRKRGVFAPKNITRPSPIVFSLSSAPTKQETSCVHVNAARAAWKQGGQGHFGVTSSGGGHRGSPGVTSFMFSERSALPIVSLGHIYKSPKCESHPKGRKGKGSVLAPPQPCCWKFSREHC